MVEKTQSAGRVGGYGGSPDHTASQERPWLAVTSMAAGRVGPVTPLTTQSSSPWVAEIAEAVREIDPEILINVHIVPWRRDDFDGALQRVAGQDPAALSKIADFLSPMAYSFMLRRPPEWVASVVEDLGWVADCPILPSIQVSPAYREGEVFSAGDFEAALLSALEPPSAGVIFWSWDHIEADAEKSGVIRKIVQGH